MELTWFACTLARFDRLSGCFLQDKISQCVLKTLTGLGPTQMQETPGNFEELVAKELGIAKIKAAK